MIRQTGGSALGATSTRSRPFSWAMRNASLVGMIPTCEPSSAITRTSRARNIVEFGTSFGVSTIFLAAALRDNGGGRLVTTERWPSKTERARANLVRAGLDHLVEFRTGVAMETLRSEQPASVDLLFLDGPKALYLDVLKLVEPRLVSGAAIASDNTDMDGAGGYLEHVRDRWNGYTSCALLTAALGAHHGHEIVLRN